MRIMFAALVMMFVASTALGETPVIKMYAGAQGVWYDDDVKPSDFEAGGNARASLSPHISAVGCAYYGVSHSYLRGSIGARVTATDVDNPNFSIGLGIQYQASSRPDIRAQEWVPDVTIGWKPWPNDLPRWIVIGQAGYGLTTNAGNAIAGVRYELGGFGQ